MNEGFLKKQAALFDGLFALSDILVIVFCFLIVHRVTEGDYYLKIESVWLLQAHILTTYVVFRLTGVYGSSRGRSKTEEIWRLLVSWSVVILIIGLFAFLTKTGEIVSRIWFGFSTLSAFFAMSVLRILIRMVLNHLRSMGLNWRSIVVVGDRDLASRAIDRLDENQWAGLKLDGVFVDQRSDGLSLAATDQTVNGYQPRGAIEDMHKFVEQRRADGLPIDQVWITLPLSAEATTQAILSHLRDSSVDVCLVPDVFGMTLLRGSIDEIGGIPLINLSNVRISGIDEALKRVFDFILALIAIIALSPVLLVIAVMIKHDSKGPIIFKQNRYGIDGRVIEVLKFRTMRVAVGDDDTVEQATRNDPRVTHLGTTLRKFSLDELPQFFNVLLGNMSLVGPRPHAVLHNEQYRGKIEGYMMRHKMKPGITGWAQVNGWRGETDTLEKMQRRVEHDLYYMENWSIWLDIKILTLTVMRGFKVKDVY